MTICFWNQDDPLIFWRTISLWHRSVVHIRIQSMSNFIAVDVGCQDFLISTWNTSANMSIGNEVTFILNDSQKKNTPYRFSCVLI